MFAPITRSGARMEVQRGEQLIAKGQFDAARSAFNRAVQLDGKNAQAHAGLARVAEHGKDLKEAANQYRAAVRYDAGNFDYALSLANVLRETLVQGIDAETAEATLRAYEYARGLAPTRFEPLVAMATCYRILGDYDQAQKYAQQAVQINPSSLEALHEKGLICQARGEYQSGLATFRLALEINPNDVVAHNGCGQIYCVLARSRGNKGAENRQQAMVHFKRSLQIDSNQPEIQKMMDSLAPYEYKGVTVSQQRTSEN